MTWNGATVGAPSRRRPAPDDARAALHAVGGPEEVRGDLEDALFEIKRVIVGQEAMLERVLVALLAGGHVLLEGVPGLAKTLTVKTVADVLGGTFNRIQFTPDLVPSDLVGTRVLRPDTNGFDTELGPVFCNFLLADEINRAPAKVQSALLEVMQERQVTIGHQTHPVPRPFLVLATQNPIESEGTYPLPEAQVDRFMFKLVVDYPSDREEAAVVARSLGGPIEVEQRAVARPRSQRHQRATQRGLRRPPGRRVRGRADGGDAPRRARTSSSARRRAARSTWSTPARALALLRGRSYALPVDVRDLARDVLRHRIVAHLRGARRRRHARPPARRGPRAAVAMPHIELSRADAAG